LYALLSESAAFYTQCTMVGALLMT
jgi:hypothetical protein